MATARADAWQQNDLRTERPPLPRSDRRPPPPLPPLPPLPELPGRGRAARTTGPHDRAAGRPGSDRMRPADPMRPADRGLRLDVDRARPPVPRGTARPARPVGRDEGHLRRDEARLPRASRPLESPGRETSGGRLRGSVAVSGVFLATLLGAAVDSFVGMGLGTITLIALVASTAISVLLVRRDDMISVVLAPPLVFTAVAGMNIALAPSVGLSLPTAATLLIRGFPTMAAATAAAIVLCLVRLATRR